MFEPVGSKQETWNINEPVKCPTEEYPYIFTSKNSHKTANKLQSDNIDQGAGNINDDNVTTIITTMDNATSMMVVGVTAKFNTTGDYTYAVRKSAIRLSFNTTNSTSDPAMKTLGSC